MQVPGVGPVTATALIATVGNAHAFRNGRQLAAWLGVVPRQHSRGGTRRLGRWVTALHTRRGFNKAVVALAAKQARILWALLATGRTYQPAVACP